MKEQDDTESLFIIENGQLEVFVYMEGNKFVMSHLNAGSVLNHRCIFTEDNMLVNVRATMPTYVLELTERDMERLKEED